MDGALEMWKNFPELGDLSEGKGLLATNEDAANPCYFGSAEIDIKGIECKSPKKAVYRQADTSEH